MRQCLVILKSIQIGEEQLQESEEDLWQLQKALKLTPLSSSPLKTTHPHEGNSANSQKRKQTKKVVGKPLPRRYPLQDQEEESDRTRSL